MTEYPRLVAGLTLVSGSRAAAEDAVQEALARAWDRSERGERIDSLKAWVTTVSMNVARSGYRRRRAEHRARERVVAGASPAVRGPEAAGGTVDLERALAALPRRQREATILRYYLDLDVREVARTLRIHEGTAKTTLFRARRALAAALGVNETEEANDHAGR